MAENENRSTPPLETQVREGFSLEWAKADSADKKKISASKNNAEDS